MTPLGAFRRLPRKTTTSAPLRHLPFLRAPTLADATAAQQAEEKRETRERELSQSEPGTTRAKESSAHLAPGTWPGASWAGNALKTGRFVPVCCFVVFGPAERTNHYNNWCRLKRNLMARPPRQALPRRLARPRPARPLTRRIPLLTVLLLAQASASWAFCNQRLGECTSKASLQHPPRPQWWPRSCAELIGMLSPSNSAPSIFAVSDAAVDGCWTTSCCCALFGTALHIPSSSMRRA